MARVSSSTRFRPDFAILGGVPLGLGMRAAALAARAH
jgi:hypothetical protein